MSAQPSMFVYLLHVYNTMHSSKLLRAFRTKYTQSIIGPLPYFSLIFFHCYPKSIWMFVAKKINRSSGKSSGSTFLFIWHAIVTTDWHVACNGRYEDLLTPRCHSLQWAFEISVECWQDENRSSSSLVASGWKRSFSVSYYTVYIYIYNALK